MTLLEPEAAAIDVQALLSVILGKIGVALCLFDADDRVLLWNDAYLRFFPEETAILRRGTSYAETLRQYFQANLPASEAESIDRHVEAGLERHRRQGEPHVYQRRDGRWYEVQSHRLADGCLLKIWTDVTASHVAWAARLGVTDAVAADIGFAQYDRAGRFMLANAAMSALFPQVVDLFRTGVSYGEHLRRFANRALAEAEGGRIEHLAVRADPMAEPVREPLIFQRRDGGWLQLEERHVGLEGFTSLWTDVTGRMNAEAQVSQLQDRLADAVEAIADGFALYDADDRLVICNSRYRDLNALSADALVPGVRWFDFLKVGAHRGQYADAIGREGEWLAERSAQRQRVGEPFEVLLGDGRWMRVVDWRTRDGGMVGIRIDITAMKQREAELIRRTAMLDAVGYAATAIVGHVGWQAGIQQLLNRLGEAAGVSRVTVFQVHRHPDLGEVQSCRYDWAEPGLDPLSDDPRNWNQSLAEGEPMFLEWTERRRAGEAIEVMTRDLTGFLRHEFERHGTLSFVSVPIFVNHEWWGHIGFDDCRTERVWTAVERDVLNTAGTLIAGAIERVHVEERLRLSEERYRRLVNLLPDGVMLHDRQGITFLNPAGCSILGLSDPGDVLGRSYTDFLVEPDAVIDRDAMQRLLEKGGEIPLSERGVRTSDGRMIFVKATAVPFSYEGVATALLLFRDITGRIETERELAQHRNHLEDLVARRTAALRAAEERMVAAINTFTGGFALYDADERLVVVNDAIADLAPHLAEILKPGASLETVTRAIAAARGLDEQWVAEELRRFRGAEDFDEERSLPDGRSIVVSVRHPPDGSALVVVTDITPYREAAEALRKALKKERQLGRLQREFVSMTSHEFRTPLAIIDAAIQRLMRRQKTLPHEEFVELGQDIRAAVARMVGHIDAILSTARLDIGEIRFDPKPCDLGAILREVCRRQEAIAGQHRIVLDLDRLPAMVFGDPGLLDQVATNVLTNAVKYSPDGGEIVIRGWTDGADAVWSIGDKGIGIPAEDLPHILQRFYRARTSIGIAGTGLGLSFVNKLVTMHGGAMDIVSTEGEGTTVTIRLPVAGPSRSTRPSPDQGGIDGDDPVH